MFSIIINCFICQKWAVLRKAVQWAPFVQVYRKKYPWVQLAGHQGMYMYMYVSIPVIVSVSSLSVYTCICMCLYL